MNNPATGLQKVRIFKPHTHAGKRYTPGPEGVEIEVGAHDVEFLKRAGVLDNPATPDALPASIEPPATIDPPAAVGPLTPRGGTRPQG